MANESETSAKKQPSVVVPGRPESGVFPKESTETDATDAELATAPTMPVPPPDAEFLDGGLLTASDVPTSAPLPADLMALAEDDSRVA
jgi:hypothetical protein